MTQLKDFVEFVKWLSDGVKRELTLIKIHAQSWILAVLIKFTIWVGQRFGYEITCYCKLADDNTSE